MTSRKWNIVGLLITLGLGVALLFAPYPADPVPGDGSDMMFYDIMAAFVGTGAFGISALKPPDPKGPFTPFIYFFGIGSVAVLVFAQVALWTM